MIDWYCFGEDWYCFDEVGCFCDDICFCNRGSGLVEFGVIFGYGSGRSFENESGNIYEKCFLF